MSSTRWAVEMLVTDSNLPQRLATIIGAGHASMIRGAQIAPELTYGRHAGPAPSTARHAAVMLLLFQRDGAWQIPLTARPAALSRHGGQISLPGGTIDSGEASDQAAVRELREELGVIEPVHLLGPMADSYVYVSNFVITPWLGYVLRAPHWRPNAAEVEHVVELPIAALLDPQSIRETTIQRGPLVFRTPCYRVDTHCIWGATSVILSELRNLLLRLIEP